VSGSFTFQSLKLKTRARTTESHQPVSLFQCHIFVLHWVESLWNLRTFFSKQCPSSVANPVTQDPDTERVGVGSECEWMHDGFILISANTIGEFIHFLKRLHRTLYGNFFLHVIHLLNPHGFTQSFLRYSWFS